MLTRQHAHELWGDCFLEVPEGALKGLPIPGRSKRFLREVGLPSKTAFLTTFELVGGRFPPLAEYADVEGLEISSEAAHLWRVGEVFDCQLCLDGNNYGAVVAVHLDAPGRKQWVNSGIEQFVTALYLHAVLCGSVPCTALEHQEAEEQFVQALRNCDPVALSHESNWWAQVVTEMVEAGRTYGVAAVGRSGAFVVDVLSTPEGNWMLSIEAPGWCCDFDLAGPSSVADLARFLRTYAGREEFAELVVGVLGRMTVRVVKDDEFPDRLFLRAAGNGSLVEFTLVGSDAREFAEAVEQVSVEFEA